MFDRIVTATRLRHFHAFLLLAGVVMTPVSVASAGLRESVPYLVAVSMLALVLSEFSSWQAARAEQAGDDAETIARKVIDLLVAEGHVRPPMEPPYESGVTGQADRRARS